MACSDILIFVGIHIDISALTVLFIEQKCAKKQVSGSHGKNRFLALMRTCN